jgi:protoporphyrinogen oxidase
MSHPIVIIGAGPAGLAAAHELVKQNRRPIVLEKADKVGGIARTEIYKGYRFDIGGHRFFTKASEVQQLWEEMLGDDFLRVPRRSSIYYRGRFLDYPITFFNALSNLGPVQSLLILLSYFRARLRPYPEEDTFEQYVSNRMGKRLYETFFKSYTEKVWGIPCSEIRAEWAAQRIKGLSLREAVTNALFGTSQAQSLIKEFRYPVFGPGMMWQRFREVVESHGGEVELNTKVTRIRREGQRVKNVVAQQGERTVQISGEHYLSSMPLSELVAQLDPPPPAEVVRAARKLRYRSFAIAGLILDQPDMPPDNWIYVHSEDVKVGRIQILNNWSAALVPDADRTSIGMEYFCDEGDEIWTMADSHLIELAGRELASMSLADSADVEDGVVYRQPKAYPVYNGDYLQHLNVIQRFLSAFENLQTIGRNGLHRYNNQDHSMLSGMLAARNLLGQDHDLWDVNTERSYHEEIQAGDSV